MLERSDMSKVPHSAGEPAAPRCSEAAAAVLRSTACTAVVQASRAARLLALVQWVERARRWSSAIEFASREGCANVKATLPPEFDDCCSEGLAWLVQHVEFEITDVAQALQFARGAQ